jgi:hypothetical protein
MRASFPGQAHAALAWGVQAAHPWLVLYIREGRSSRPAQVRQKQNGSSQSTVYRTLGDLQTGLSGITPSSSIDFSTVAPQSNQ